jgi:hypothetical protein
MLRSIVATAFVACSLVAGQANSDGSLAHLIYCLAVPKDNGNVLYNVGFKDVQQKSISSICTNYKNAMSGRGVQVQCRANPGAQLLTLGFELGTPLYTGEYSSFWED